MKKTGLILSFLSLFFFGCKKDTTSITINGRVTDHFSGKPISGVQISVFPSTSSGGSWVASSTNHTNATVTTNSNGEYQFNIAVASSDADVKDWELLANLRINLGAYLILQQRTIYLGSNLKGQRNVDFYGYSNLKVNVIDTSGSTYSLANLWINTVDQQNSPSIGCTPSVQNCTLNCVTSTTNTVTCLLIPSTSGPTDTLKKIIYCKADTITTLTIKY